MMSTGLMDKAGTLTAVSIALTLWTSVFYNYGALIQRVLNIGEPAGNALFLLVATTLSSIQLTVLNRLGPASALTAEILMANLPKILRRSQLQILQVLVIIWLMASIGLFQLADSNRLRLFLLIVVSIPLLVYPLLTLAQRAQREKLKFWLVTVHEFITLGFFACFTFLTQPWHLALLDGFVTVNVVYILVCLGLIAWLLPARLSLPPRWSLIGGASFRDGLLLQVISGNNLAAQVDADKRNTSLRRPLKPLCSPYLNLYCTLVLRHLGKLFKSYFMGVVCVVFLYRSFGSVSVFLACTVFSVLLLTRLLEVWEDWATSAATQRMLISEGGSVASQRIKTQLAVVLGIFTLSLAVPVSLYLVLGTRFSEMLLIVVFNVIGLIAHLHEVNKMLVIKQRIPIITPDGMIIDSSIFHHHGTWIALVIIAATTSFVSLSLTGGLALSLLSWYGCHTWKWRNTHKIVG